MTTMADPRESLRLKLSEVIGDRHADTLMRALPVPDGVDLATRSDIDRLGNEIGRLSTDINGLRVDVGGLRTEVGGLRTEVGGLRTEVGGLRVDVDGLKTDVVTLKAEVAGLERRVDRIEDKIDRGFFQLGAEMRGHSRLFVVTQIGSVLTLGGLLVAFMALV